MLKKTALFLCAALAPLAACAYEVTALGGMVYDHMFLVEQSFLDELDGSLYGSAEASPEEFRSLLAKLPSEPRRVHGGSARNVIGALRQLGRQSKFFTCSGQDAVGKAALAKLDEQDIDYKVAFSPESSGQTICLVSPDGERTIRWMEDCREALDRLQFKPQEFRGAKIAHFEGYRCANEALIRRYVAAAKAAGCLISMDLGSHEMVGAFRPFFEELISEHADILFANADEARSLTGLGPSEAAELLQHDSLLVVVTDGANGCYVTQGGAVQHIAAHDCQPVDTTGAGDFFAAGFLHGLLYGLPLDACADCGHLMASRCIENLGCIVTTTQLIELKREMRILRRAQLPLQAL